MIHELITLISGAWLTYLNSIYIVGLTGISVFIQEFKPYFYTSLR